MILLINGDSHSAAAECVNTYGFAEDDSKYFMQGRRPHPDNLVKSFGYLLSKPLQLGLVMMAESGSSNDRIMRTTRDYLKEHDTDNTLVVIGWSTWERKEWKIHGEYYQIGSSGADHLPESHQSKYKDWVTARPRWEDVTKQAHKDIWVFHQELLEHNVKHVFFNCNNHFSDIVEQDRRDWGVNYIAPYDYTQTYDYWLQTNGYQYVRKGSMHYGPDAHQAWKKKLLKYILDNKLA